MGGRHKAVLGATILGESYQPRWRELLAVGFGIASPVGGSTTSKESIG